MPKLNEEQLLELNHIKDWYITILDYMASAYKDATAPTMFSSIIIEQYEKQNLKGLRHCIKDINEMAKAGSLADIENINKILKEKFGKSLSEESDKMIKNILKRGKISNPDEYRLLQSKADEIYMDYNFVNELDDINGLLVQYDVDEQKEK